MGVETLRLDTCDFKFGDRRSHGKEFEWMKMVTLSMKVYCVMVSSAQSRLLFGPQGQLVRTQRQ